MGNCEGEGPNNVPRGGRRVRHVVCRKEDGGRGGGKWPQRGASADLSHGAGPGGAEAQVLLVLFRRSYVLQVEI